MPDDAEILYCYDSDHARFGYSFNVDYPLCSEWGLRAVSHAVYRLRRTPLAKPAGRSG